MRTMCAVARSLSPASHGTAPRPESAEAASSITAGAAPFTKQRTTGRPVASVAEVNVRHQLVDRVEREDGEPGQPGTGGVDIEGCLVPQHEQRPLRGITDDLPVDELGVARDDVGQDRGFDRRRAPGRVVDLALERVAGARDGVAIARGADLHHRHLVHRQRAGLVRVDRRGERQRLDRRQLLDDRVALRQVDPTDREDPLGHRRQCLGDRRDRQRDRADEQHVPCLARDCDRG